MQNCTAPSITSTTHTSPSTGSTAETVIVGQAVKRPGRRAPAPRPPRAWASAFDPGTTGWS
ncbi:hypothetical protein O1M54_48780 [Streptomyces diastatochromogenes]|nr:hypothetical protein [Streptomyces diastatochromogenes]